MGFFNRAEKTGTDLSLKKISVSQKRCPQNHPCPSVRVCPVTALKQKGYNAPEVDEEKCIKCGRCVNYCPMGAIQFS